MIVELTCNRKHRAGEVQYGHVTAAVEVDPAVANGDSFRDVHLRGFPCPACGRPFQPAELRRAAAALNKLRQWQKTMGVEP